MKKVLDYLHKLDFSEVEAKLYLKLLKSGQMTATELAEAVGINRTAAYAYINSLLTKGVIAKLTGKSSKLVANPPEHLQYLIEQKITETSMLKETFPSILSALYTSLPEKKNDTQSDMRYYKGRTGVKAIYEEVLRSEKIRSYFNAGDIVKIFPENAELFQSAFLSNAKLRIFEILEHSVDTINQMEPYGNIDRHFHKILPKDVRLTSNDILIYDGKVAIVNIGDKDNVTGVVLENRDYYNNSAQLFDLLWRLLPEPK